MSDQHDLIKIEELVSKLNTYFDASFSSTQIVNMRKAGLIPAEDVRTPGTNIPRWKYNFDNVVNAIEKK